MSIGASKDDIFRTDGEPDQILIPKNDEKAHAKRSSRPSAQSFPIIYEAGSDSKSTAAPDAAYVPPPSASSAGFNAQQRRSTDGTSHERQLSLLDPTSDRVSTILVWQNLIVSTRVSKRKQVLQRFKAPDKREPDSKRLLHNVSGAITGGLWAVMGESLSSDRPGITVIEPRSVWLWQVHAAQHIGVPVGCQYCFRGRDASQRCTVRQR